MAAVPYPCFVTNKPVDVEGKSAALWSVGRCRIDPSTIVIEDNGTGTGTSSTLTKYRDIVAKNIEQAHVDLDPSTTEEGKKKLRKKYMKEGVAMAKKYLQEDLQLDLSVIDVEVVVDAVDLIATDGCLASCLLDAGCQTIVTDGTNLEALDAAKIPSSRLLGHFTYAVDGMFQAIDATQPYCTSVSVLLENSEDVSEDAMLSIIESVDPNFEVIVQVPQSYCSTTPLDQVSKMVGSVCKAVKEGKGTVCLIDPTAQQLGLCYAACLYTDREDGLYTTVVCTRNGEALGLVYSSIESIVASLECGRGVYYSRSRKGLWRKGDTSGHYQTLHRLDADCDGDAIRFTVTQRGEDVAAFCHLNTLTCWGMPRGLRLLEETLQDRCRSAPEGSYTKRLLDDADLLREKLVEEAQELSEADTKQHVAEELADVLYFCMVRAVKAGVTIDDAVSELDRRSRKVTRRKGDSKAFRIAAGKAILEKKKAPPDP